MYRNILECGSDLASFRLWQTKQMWRGYIVHHAVYINYGAKSVTETHNLLGHRLGKSWHLPFLNPHTDCCALKQLNNPSMLLTLPPSEAKNEQHICENAWAHLGPQLLSALAGAEAWSKSLSARRGPGNAWSHVHVCLKRHPTAGISTP